MANVSVFIKKDYVDKNNESVIVLQYSHAYKSFKINTGIKINPSYADCEYDSDFEIWKLVSTRQLKTSEKGKLKEANEKLREVYVSLNRTILDLKSRSLSLNASYVKQEYFKEPAKKIELVSKSVHTWYIEFIAAKEKEMGSGINSYRSTFEHFKEFTANRGVVHLLDMNKAFLEEFRDFLLKEELEGSTVHKQFKNLRIFLNWVLAQDENGEIKIPLAFKKFNVKARYGDPIGLTVDQFFQFLQFDLSKRRFLETTRDVFVFAVSIGGPRHGDLSRLSETLRKNGFSVNQNSITYFEGKTGNAHREIDLNKIGMQILAKYSNVIPQVPSNFRMNQNLKAIARLLKWNDIKYIPKYNSYGKLIGVEEVPLHKIFSTKFMRKTAATIDNMLGVPHKTSMKRTGHKTFAAYSRYVDVNKESMIQANKQWDGLADSELKEPKEIYRVAS